MKSYILIGAVALSLVGCGDDAGATAADGHDHAAEEQAAGPTNRTPIPAVVRRNLGITFAKAAYRPVADTVQVPGHFEPQPSAQHHYPLPADGRVTVHVKPLQQVEQGHLLFELDSPAWRELQGELVDTQASLLRASADVTKAQATQEAAGSIRQSAADDGVDVYAAEVSAAIAARDAVRDRFDQLIAQASTLTGLTPAALADEREGKPAWRQLNAIPVRAVDVGTVRHVDAASGTWAEAGTEMVHVVHASSLRFRGRALQSDLIDALREGQPVHLAPPEGKGNKRRQKAVVGTLRLGVTGDAGTRTVDIFVDVDPKAVQPWMRPEVTAMAEVAVAGDPDMEELAIPLRAIIQDGLDTVYFRRDPKDPDVVIRTDADLGPSDGKWITVYSGLAEGDEVVIDGVYQLKLATTGQDVTAGHFHSDGTWHEGDH